MIQSKLLKLCPEKYSTYQCWRQTTPEERLLVECSCFSFESETLLVSSDSSQALHGSQKSATQQGPPCQPENPLCGVCAGRLSMCMITFARWGCTANTKGRGKLKRHFVWPRILSTFVSVAAAFVLFVGS